jgi:CRP-like cAMP-binding protein
MNTFTRASVNAIASMAQHMTEVRYAPGESIWKIGDPVLENLLMVRGSIVCKDNEGRTFRYGAGFAVGGLEAFAGAPRWYDAVADTPIVALRVRHDELFDMFEDNHEMAFDFLAMLAADLLGDWVKKIEAGVVLGEMLRDLRIFCAGLPLI